MSQDIRRMSREDLDELNRQIAIYKGRRRPQPVQEVLSENADFHKPTKALEDAQQLDLL
jgi:hypothetical protein